MGFLGRGDVSAVLTPWKRRELTRSSSDIDLWSACKTGNIDFVKSIIDEAPELLHVQLQGRSPLYYACLCGHVEIVKLLLQSGCTDDDFRSCHRAALTPEIRKLLKQYKFVEHVLMGNSFPMVPNAATQPAVFTNLPFDEEIPNPFPEVTAAHASLLDDSQSLATIPVNNTTASSSLKVVPFLEIISPATADEIVSGLVDSDDLEEICDYSSQEHEPPRQSPARTIEISMSGAVEVQETTDLADLINNTKRQAPWKHPLRQNATKLINKVVSARRLIPVIQTSPKNVIHEFSQSPENDETIKSPQLYHSTEDNVMEKSSNGDDIVEVVLQRDNDADLQIVKGPNRKKSPWTSLKRTLLPTRKVSTIQTPSIQLRNDPSTPFVSDISITDHLFINGLESLTNVVAPAMEIEPVEDPIKRHLIDESVEWDASNDELPMEIESSEAQTVSLQPIQRSTQSSSTFRSFASFDTTTTATTNGDNAKRALIPITCVPVTATETEVIHASNQVTDQNEQVLLEDSTTAALPFINEVKPCEQGVHSRARAGWNRFFFGALRSTKLSASGGHSDSEMETASTAFAAQLKIAGRREVSPPASDKENIDLQSNSSVSGNDINSASIVSALEEATYLGSERPGCTLQCNESEKSEVPRGVVQITLEACGCIGEEMMVDEYSLTTLSFDAPLLPKVLRGRSTATNISTLSQASRELNKETNTQEEVEPSKEEVATIVESSQSSLSSEHSSAVPNEVSICSQIHANNHLSWDSPEIDSDAKHAPRVRRSSSSAEEDAPSLVSESSDSFYKGDNDSNSQEDHTITTAEHTNDMVSRAASERTFEIHDTWCGPTCY